MSAARGFMLADSAVFDQAEYDAYRAVVAPSVERHGGTFIIRGGASSGSRATASGTASSGSSSPASTRRAAGTRRRSTRR